MPTAIDQLVQILNDKQDIPDAQMEKWNFAGKYFALKFKEYLSPDSQHYRCALNPIFTYEFEMSEKKFLSQVKVFSLRDGVMPLMRFFTINPSPENHCPLLIVDARLSSLVPEKWRSKVVLRTAFMNEARKQSNRLLLFISPDMQGLPLEIFNEELNRVEKNLNNDDEICVLFSSMRMRGEGEAYCDKAWGYKLLLILMKKFGNRNVQILNYQDYLNMDISFARFTFINPLLFYFSDSFLFHNAAQRGAHELNTRSLPEHFPHLNLSLNHGFYFHQNFESYRGENYEKIQRTLFSSIRTYAMTKQFSDINNKFYPKDFSDWGLDEALDLYRTCHKSV